jgi:hypothetical protein
MSFLFKTFLSVFFLIILLSSPDKIYSQETSSAYSLLDKCTKAYSAIYRVSYTLKYTGKPLYEKDTIRKTARVWTEKKAADSWHWPFLLIEETDSLSEESDGTLVWNYSNKKIISKDSIGNIPRFYHGNYRETYFCEPFFKEKPSEYFALLKASLGKYNIRDTVIRKNPCYVIRMDLKQQDESIKEDYITLFISKESFLIIKEIDWIVLNNDEVQYDECDFLKIVVNKKAKKPGR